MSGAGQEETDQLSSVIIKLKYKARLKELNIKKV